MTVTATDGSVEAIAKLYVFALYASVAELIWDGQTRPGYSVVSNIGGGSYELVISHDGAGFPADFTLIGVAVGMQGTIVTDEANIDVEPEPIIGDVTPPVVSNITPPPGTPIEPFDAITFDITDDSGSFRRVLLAVVYASGDLAGITELMHDGDTFLGYYSSGTCSRTPITNGFRFTVLRSGGWPASPTIRVFAFDPSGNEV